MKTKEEWATIWSGTTSSAATYMQDLTRMVEQIQFDAWRQGMTDAAEICDTQYVLGTKRSILTARDNKTECGK